MYVSECVFMPVHKVIYAPHILQAPANNRQQKLTKKQGDHSGDCVSVAEFYSLSATTCDDITQAINNLILED